MVYTLNRMSFEFAQKLIKRRLLVIDRDNDWVDHKPSRGRRKAFLEIYGPVEYGKWHLAEDEGVAQRSFNRFAFLIGDFTRMHRCALIAAQLETGKLNNMNIRDALAQLLTQIDALKDKSGPRSAA
jgi:hypothetical protein